MANMIMASSSSSSQTLIPLPQTSPMKTHTHKIINSLKTHQNQTQTKKRMMTISVPSMVESLKPTTTTLAAAAAALVAMGGSGPALAAEIEKAALFDFNLTLPIIMGEFLLLMVALDKIYYTPMGEFMDKRDAEIKAQLGSVKDTSAEVKQLEEQAVAVMRAARAEITAALNQMKKETTAELEAKMEEGRKKVEAELQEALAKLEVQKEETLKALDSQIAALSDDIVKKVLPI